MLASACVHLACRPTQHAARPPAGSPPPQRTLEDSPAAADHQAPAAAAAACEGQRARAAAMPAGQASGTRPRHCCTLAVTVLPLAPPVMLQVQAAAELVLALPLPSWRMACTAPAMHKPAAAAAAPRTAAARSLSAAPALAAAAGWRCCRSRRAPAARRDLRMHAPEQVGCSGCACTLGCCPPDACPSLTCCHAPQRHKRNAAPCRQHRLHGGRPAGATAAVRLLLALLMLHRRRPVGPS